MSRPRNLYPRDVLSNSVGFAVYFGYRSQEWPIAIGIGGFPIRSLTADEARSLAAILVARADEIAVEEDTTMARPQDVHSKHGGSQHV